MSVTFDTRELKAFQLTIQRMGGIPTKVATKAASKGATVVRREVRSRIPVGETGELKRGIKRKGERSRIKGKKVYDLMFDPAKNSIFQKPVKHPGFVGTPGDVRERSLVGQIILHPAHKRPVARIVRVKRALDGRGDNRS